MQAFRLTYAEYGSPLTVIKREDFELNTQLCEQEVLVKMLAAPINPSDINQIEGVYPIRPALPAVAGNEGVAEVLAVAPNVSSLAVGDWVIPHGLGWGTWRSHGVWPSQSFIKVAKDIGVAAAASLSVNPSSALRMLRDFTALAPGDCVVQNGANSSVGLCVIQIAKALGIKTINVIRDREDFEDVKVQLLQLGADHVISESFARTPAVKDLFKDIPRPRLALNCIGGKSSTSVMRLLMDGGHHVTYGGMSKEPVTIPTGALIFNNIRFHGFWNSRAREEESRTETEKLLAELSSMIRKSQLKIICDLLPASDYTTALKTAITPGKPRKVLLAF